MFTVKRSIYPRLFFLEYMRSVLSKVTGFEKSDHKNILSPVLTKSISFNANYTRKFLFKVMISTAKVVKRDHG